MCANRLEVGQKVRIPSTGEVGVIIHTWLDECGDQDAYIAFFGLEFPSGKTDMPYTLRYYTAGLEVIE